MSCPALQRHPGAARHVIFPPCMLPRLCQCRGCICPRWVCPPVWVLPVVQCVSRRSLQVACLAMACRNALIGSEVIPLLQRTLSIPITSSVKDMHETFWWWIHICFLTRRACACMMRRHITLLDALGHNASQHRAMDAGTPHNYFTPPAQARTPLTDGPCTGDTSWGIPGSGW